MRLPLSKITIAIASAVVTPLFLYSLFQYAQSNRNEQLLLSIYQRELESILFSINQYCWDTYASWATELRTLAETFNEHQSRERLLRDLTSYLEEEECLEAALLATIGSKGVAAGKVRRLPAQRVTKDLLEHLPARERELARAISQAEKGYVRPVAFSSGDFPGTTWLVFPCGTPGDTVTVGCLLIDNWKFANDILARKLNTIGNGHFLFSVLDVQTSKVLYETEEIEEAEFERSENLWILPNLRIRVKLPGTTLGQVARHTTRRNLAYLGVVNLVIIVGTFFLLRNVHHEMRLAQMKTDFVANVSHEIRTPLSLIRMYAEMLEMGRVPSAEKQKQYYRTIMSESARLTQLINNILDFARLEAKRKQYHFASVSLNEVVSDTVDMLGFHLQQQGFELDLNLAQELPLIRGDTQAITQALVNLIDNAVKFSRDVRRIEIRTGKTNGNAFVSVRDFGIGIPDSEQKKIFEKFYRIGGTLVHETKGSGLGLAIVKQIMEDHRGEVRLKSKQGEGSTFTLVFPIAEGRKNHG